MILARPFQPEDRKAVEFLYKSQGFDYVAPDWGALPVSCVLEVDGRIEMAAFFRKTAETFLLSAPGGRRTKLGELLILHKELVEPLRSSGFSDIHCWIPPEIEDRFGKLLLHLKWKKQLWPSYSREVM